MLQPLQTAFTPIKPHFKSRDKPSGFPDTDKPLRTGGAVDAFSAATHLLITALSTIILPLAGVSCRTFSGVIKTCFITADAILATGFVVCSPFTRVAAASADTLLLTADTAFTFGVVWLTYASRIGVFFAGVPTDTQFITANTVITWGVVWLTYTGLIGIICTAASANTHPITADTAYTWGVVWLALARIP